jgi:hypothetical protein
VQESKNDSVLYLLNTGAGKKTRLQLQKYTVDSWYGLNNGWSRLTFQTNYSLILSIGTIESIDSTLNTKLGGSRAFEIFAKYWEKTNSGTAWWAEYVRWTDFGGVGYMVSIVGDTLDLIENVMNNNYVSLLDSIKLTQFTTREISEKKQHSIVQQYHDRNEIIWFDILGRNLQDYYGQKPITISVRKNIKQCIIK